MLNNNNLVSAFKRYDFSFFGIACGIFLVGIINLYSATHATTRDVAEGLYLTQVMWFFLSAAIGVFVSFINTKTWHRLSYFAYAFVCIILIAVLILGHSSMGAQRWISIAGVRFQPSEITKLAVVMCLARWFSRLQNDRETGLKDLIIPFLIAMLPALLIIVQPDLGTGMLVIVISFFMAFYRKLKWQSLAIIAMIVIVSGSAMYKFGLKEYQRKRIVTFLDPSADAKGSGYNAIQSKIAIGSGQFFGKGFRKSSQASLNYLPENHTDFVFAIFNEEHGFFGSLLLISLYLILFYRFLWLSTSVNKFFDSLLVIGMLGIFIAHTLINMAMVTGLMPIVGIPLPFMSFGGSSLVTLFVCIGIATQISNSRNLF